MRIIKESKKNTLHVYKAHTFSKLLITASWAGFFKDLNLSTVSKGNIQEVIKQFKTIYLFKSLPLWFNTCTVPYCDSDFNCGARNYP